MTAGAFAPALNRWTPYRRLGESVSLPAGISGPTIGSARELEEELRQAGARLAHVERLAEEAAEGVRAIHAEYQAALDREAATGEDGIADKLKAKRDAAEAKAREDWPPKINAAHDRQKAAREALEQFFTADNALAIVAELEPEAVKVTAELAELRQRFEEQASQLRLRWAEIESASRSVLGRIEPFEREDVPSNPESGELPLPTVEALERYDRHVNPAPAQPAHEVTITPVQIG